MEIDSGYQNDKASPTNSSRREQDGSFHHTQDHINSRESQSKENWVARHIRTIAAVAAVSSLIFGGDIHASPVKASNNTNPNKTGQLSKSPDTKPADTRSNGGAVIQPFKPTGKYTPNGPKLNFKELVIPVVLNDGVRPEYDETYIKEVYSGVPTDPGKYNDPPLTGQIAPAGEVNVENYLKDSSFGRINMSISYEDTQTTPSTFSKSCNFSNPTDYNKFVTYQNSLLKKFNIKSSQFDGIIFVYPNLENCYLQQGTGIEGVDGVTAIGKSQDTFYNSLILSQGAEGLTQTAIHEIFRQFQLAQIPLGEVDQVDCPKNGLTNKCTIIMAPANRTSDPLGIPPAMG